MKYYEGSVHKVAGSKKLNKCSICGAERLGFKIREDKALVCFDCWSKDTEKDTEELKLQNKI